MVPLFLSLCPQLAFLPQSTLSTPFISVTQSRSYVCKTRRPEPYCSRLLVVFMDYYWTSVGPLDTTKEFGLSPLSISPAPRSGALEAFMSPTEVLEALFQSHSHTSWEPPTTTTTTPATTILDQASFPPSVFVFSSSSSTEGLTESQSGEAKPTSFESPSPVRLPDRLNNTKLGGGEGDYRIRTPSLPIANPLIAHELLHDQCPVSALNTIRPVKPIKGMIRKHKQYMTVCYFHPLRGHSPHRSTYQSLDMTRPNVCTYCHARFERPSDCERHTRSHTSEAQYWCHNPDCPIDRRSTQYTRSDARQRHWERHVECWEWYYRSPMGVEYLEENGQRLRKFPPSILKAFVEQGIEPPKPRAPLKTKMSTLPVEQPKWTPAQKRVRGKAPSKMDKRRISPRKQPHSGTKSFPH